MDSIIWASDSFFLVSSSPVRSERKTLEVMQADLQTLHFYVCTLWSSHCSVLLGCIWTPTQFTHSWPWFYPALFLWLLNKTNNRKICRNIKRYADIDDKEKVFLSECETSLILSDAWWVGVLQYKVTKRKKQKCILIFTVWCEWPETMSK